MATANFIPQIWSAALLHEFQQAAVLAALTNRSYQGDAQVGNAVKITTAVPVEVKDYGTTRKTSPDAVTTTQVTLQINQERAFDIRIDDIDRQQAAGSMGEFAFSGAQGLVSDADKWIAAQLIAGAGSKKTGAVPDNGEAVWNIVRDLRTVLNKENVPASGQVLVVNPDFEALLLGFNSKVTAVELAAETPNGMRDAYVGRILGFDTYRTSHLPISNRPQAVAFHKSAYGFVNSITTVEAMRDADSFSDRLRGLNVYGGVAIRPSAIASFTATTGG